MDVIGPLQTSSRGRTHILVVVDAFTKWPECFPISEPNGQVVMKILLEDIIARYGCPESILTDGAKYFGKYFDKESFAEFHAAYGVERIVGAPYRHQTQGIAECFNATLYEMVGL